MATADEKIAFFDVVEDDTLGQLMDTMRALKDLPARSPRRPALEARAARLREQRLRELSVPAKRKRAS